jgi:hypothetical protein
MLLQTQNKQKQVFEISWKRQQTHLIPSKIGIFQISKKSSSLKHFWTFYVLLQFCIFDKD